MFFLVRDRSSYDVMISKLLKSCMHLSHLCILNLLHAICVNIDRRAIHTVNDTACCHYIVMVLHGTFDRVGSKWTQSESDGEKYRHI